MCEQEDEMQKKSRNCSFYLQAMASQAYSTNPPCIERLFIPRSAICLSAFSLPRPPALSFAYAGCKPTDTGCKRRYITCNSAYASCVSRIGRSRRQKPKGYTRKAGRGKQKNPAIRTPISIFFSSKYAVSRNFSLHLHLRTAIFTLIMGLRV